MKYGAIESRYRIHVGNRFTVRIWRKETEVKPRYDNSDLYKSLIDWLTSQKQEHEQFLGVVVNRLRTDEIAEFFAGLERVNCVEVIDRSIERDSPSGDEEGICIHTEWP